ncbi:MAG: hypothetical protein LBV13_04195 [Methanomassiliicoccaceae archaeon]|jgi:uncharacterized membrane protein|nr:hypothetical protein [Methanomassiliicoccaceae archaeon]
MNLERNTSFVLRYGAFFGIFIAAAGLLMDLTDPSEISRTIMAAGIAVIIITPFVRLVVSAATLAANKEKKYAAYAFLLISVTVIGMVVALYII